MCAGLEERSSEDTCRHVHGQSHKDLGLELPAFNTVRIEISSIKIPSLFLFCFVFLKPEQTVSDSCVLGSMTKP